MKTKAKMINENERGFSIVEALVIVTVMAVMGGVALVGVGGAAKAVGKTKLEQDVATLNTAVRVFKANGGKIAGSWKAAKVLEELKTKADAESAGKLAGVRGSVVDPRVVAVDETFEEAVTGEPKVLWDNLNHRFYVSTSTARGIKRFVLDEARSETETETRERAVSLALNDGDGWVWSFTDSPSAERKAPRSPGMESEPSGNGVGNGSGVELEPSGPLDLNGPVLTGVDPEAFVGVDFPVVFALEDENPDGTSVLMVSTDGQEWTEYAGPITVESDQTIYAYTESRDEASWNDSEVLIVSISGNGNGNGHGNGHGNNGHGNNEDGVDVSNPGQGHGGPNGEVDPSGPIDDEIAHGNGNGNGESVAPADWLISGYSSGAFNNVTGDERLVTNIGNGERNRYASWGTPYSSSTEANHAEFTGSLFDGVGVGERFLVGMFEYHNGTTDAGTNATAVDFQISIAFMGGTVTKSFEYSFGLYSTPNNTGTPWGDADYFGLTNIQSSGTVNIFGDDYSLELAFGHTSNNGFATIDEFHIYENSTGYGELWGTIVRF